MKKILILLIGLKLFAVSPMLYYYIKKNDKKMFNRYVNKCIGYEYVMDNGLPLIFYFNLHKSRFDMIEAQGKILYCYYKNNLNFDKFFKSEIEKYIGSKNFALLKNYLLFSKQDEKIFKYYKESKFILAIKSNNLKLVKKYFDKKKLNKFDILGYKPIHYSRSAKVLSFFLKKGAKLTTLSKDGKNLLLSYIDIYDKFGLSDFDYIKYLIVNKKIKTDFKDDYGNNVLHLAKDPLTFAYLTAFDRKNLYRRNKAGYDPLEALLIQKKFLFLGKVVKYSSFIDYIDIIDRIEFK